MPLKDFANAAGRVCFRETCEGDSVAWVGVAGEYAQNVTFVVKFHPGQAALEAKPFSSVKLDRRRELFVARQGFFIGGLLHCEGMKAGERVSADYCAAEFVN